MLERDWAPLKDNDVVLVDAIRTPVGRLGGALKDVLAEDLGTLLIQELIRRNGVPGEDVDEVILGQAKQSADASNLARIVALQAGVPESVPGYTVHRQCGSGLQAIECAAKAIRLGEADVVIAGGVESMSTAPYYLRAARYGYAAGNGELLDPNTESQPRSQPEDIYGRFSMGETAENLADEFGITREQQDLFALESQQKAWAAIESRRMAEEILPVSVPRRKGPPTIVDTDEHPRKTSLVKLASLRPAFRKNGTVTAGNASGRNDGASMVLITSGAWARKNGRKPLARLLATAVAGVSPTRMGIGPVPATRQVLQHLDIELDDVDLVEINEAFAAQTLAVLHELPVQADKLNVNGGAIALGHAIGNSGARICVTLLHEMRRRGARLGLATLCVAGGMGIASVFERLPE